ncbi:hypothetical protein EI71_00947 [Anaeroplasma bactoclasticum]|jgi:hypothetical protein|uniref:Uncharacterized protein n=1 Tax=Anaeroplasma bactoclasticum TaxID=2088 RepID=A0A397RT52_9MOLU|nr:hypothetical protein [Anaeroplasma bactoclasticum]RIA75916.1 hypothetical protein EI71_00947 [Anaeroplasma bactoclasticum]
MDKDLVFGYYNGGHYLRVGVYFLFMLLTFLVFITPMGDIRYSFLFFSLFLPLLIFEFIHHHMQISEIEKDLYKTDIMQIAKMSVIEMKKKKVGIKFEGKMNNKIVVLKLYKMDIGHKALMNNLARYKYVEMEYYPKTMVVRGYHSKLGD